MSRVAGTWRLGQIALIWLAVVFLGVELLLGTVLSVQQRRIFWFRYVTAAPGAQAKADVPLTNTVLSPYFGYIWRPRSYGFKSWEDGTYRDRIGYDKPPYYMYWTANNYGFVEGQDYPVEGLKPKDYVVAIFGGSVAQFFALDARERLVTVLRNNPKLADRNIVVLNFAAGGYKQPQQLIALSYFASLGQRFNLIINLDGLNEANIGWESIVNYGVDPLAPVARFMFGLQNVMISGEAARDSAALRARAALLERKLAETRLAWKYYILLLTLRQMNVKTVEIETEEGLPRPGRNYMISLLPAGSRDFHDHIDRIVQVWASSSALMSNIATSIGASYIHVLQPNQYFGAKVLTEAEKNPARQTANPMHEIVPPFYKAMILAGTTMRKDGVTFVDGTAAFDKHSETLYYDNCCHFNARGSRILVDELLGPVLQKLAVPPSGIKIKK